ncbi:MnhB domain-containing protein [bacterium]|nr:MnhB domain-containing protein [bacterium]
MAEGQRQAEKGEKEPDFKTSLVIRTVTRLMLPFLIMFGLNIIVHGHLTPGGGFQGGVVVGAAFILIGLAFNKEEGRRAAPDEGVKVVISSGLFIYILVGLIGICAGYNFLANRCISFPPFGELGELFGGGTLFWINIGVGLAVCGVAIGLFYAFLEEKRDAAYYKKIKRPDTKRRLRDRVSKDIAE